MPQQVNNKTLALMMAYMMNNSPKSTPPIKNVMAIRGVIALRSKPQ